MKPKLNLLYIFVGLDAALLLAAVVLFGYIFAFVRENNTQTAESSPLPQAEETLSLESAAPTQTTAPAQTPTPTPSQTPKALTVYMTQQLRFSYDPQQLTLSDRSEAVGRTAVALTFGSLDIPRVDIQVLDGTSLGISQEDFQLLAQAAAGGYFAGDYAETTVSNMVMDGEAYTAELQITATDVSPALNVYIRLIPGTNYGILAVYLTPESTAQEEIESFQETLQSITRNPA